MQMLAAGLGGLGMVQRRDFVGILGFASMDGLVSDIATSYLGAVMAPLPTNVLLEDIQHLIIEAEVSIPGGSTRRF
jgi:long-subunit acyl-CoA synthetase (AMP-forming)